MRKIYVALLTWIVLTGMLSAQELVFECDFSHGIPANFILEDKDGNIPYRTGFPENTAWISCPDPDDDDNTVACSTSLYTTSTATSDDWMIFSPVTLPSDAESISFAWRTRSAYSTYKDGYKVFVAKDIKEITDPRSIHREELLFVPRENETWTTHVVDLTKYAGETVYLAFVNCTNQGWLLYLDDITIGVGDVIKKASLKITSDVYAEKGEGIITAQIKNGIKDPITQFMINVTSGDTSWAQEFKNLSLKPNEKYNFTLNRKLEGEDAEIKEYKVSMLVDEMEVASDLSSFTYLKDVNNERKVVCEAITATWDGYGPRVNEGVAMMDEKHPDDFIAICVHGYGDEEPMSIPGDQYLNALIREYGLEYGKKMLIDRVFTGDPYTDIENLYIQRKQEKAFAGITVTGSCGDDEVEASVETRFALGMENLDYRCLLVLAENEVTRSAAGYEQKNIYSSGYFGTFLGYEKKPNVLPGVLYNHVARMIYPDVEGESSRYPVTVAMDDTITVDYKFKLPANVLDKQNLELVAMIVDGRTGSLVNADRTLLAFTGSTSVAREKINAMVSVRIESGAIRVDKANDSQMSVQVYNVQGVLQAEVCGNCSVRIPVHPKGLYLVRISCDDKVLIKKVIKE